MRIDTINAMPDAFILDIMGIIMHKTIWAASPRTALMDGVQGSGSRLDGDMIGDGIGLEQDASIMFDKLLCDKVERHIVRDGAVHGGAAGQDRRGELVGGYDGRGKNVADGGDSRPRGIGDGHLVRGVIATGQPALENDGEGEGGGQTMLDDGVGHGDGDAEPAQRVDVCGEDRMWVWMRMRDECGRTG